MVILENQEKYKLKYTDDFQATVQPNANNQSPAIGDYLQEVSKVQEYIKPLVQILQKQLQINLKLTKNDLNG